MPTDFPEPKNNYFQAKDFQDNKITLTYKSWSKKANEDLKSKDGSVTSWKKRLIYMLRYTYPEFATDEANEPIIDANTGEQMRNSNYDPEFPKGYTIEYVFNEGTLTCGSLPLFNAFCICKPKSGERLDLLRTGESTETVWKVTRPTNFASKEFSGDPEPQETVDEDIPF